jgi:hypothetical protein
MPDIEQLLRKELRTAQPIDPSKPIALIDDDSTESTVARVLLEKVFRGHPAVELVSSSTKRRTNVVVATNLEQELTRELRVFLEGIEERRRFTPIMATIPEEAIFAFAKRDRIPVRTPSSDDIRELVERLHARQPQTKAALRKSFAHLRAVAENRR